jgi:hypothetical protein
VFLTVSKSSTSNPSGVDARRLAGIAPMARHAGRNWTKADVLHYRLDGADIALKDYGARSFLVRHTIGRLLTRRELAAYEAARGLPGLPECLGRIGPWAIALEWIEGRTLADLSREPLDDAFFDGVATILAGLHDRGIALGDLHHRDVLVGPDRDAHVVDLATTLLLGGRPGRLRRALFARLKDQDLVALARLRARWTGRNEDEAVAAVGERAATWHARGRRLRRVWDRLRGRRGRRAI